MRRVVVTQKYSEACTLAWVVGQKSGVPTFPFMNGVFAMKIHALKICMYIAA